MADAGVIQVRLRKPQHWRWQLHTSASAPAVRVVDDGDAHDAPGSVDLLLDFGVADRRGFSPAVRAAESRLPRRAPVPKQKSDSSLDQRAKAKSPDTTNSSAPTANPSPIKHHSRLKKPTSYSVKQPAVPEENRAKVELRAAPKYAKDINKRYSDSLLPTLGGRRRPQTAAVVDDAGAASAGTASATAKDSRCPTSLRSAGRQKDGAIGNAARQPGVAPVKPSSATKVKGLTKQRSDSPVNIEDLLGDVPKEIKAEIRNRLKMVAEAHKFRKSSSLTSCDTELKLKSCDRKQSINKEGSVIAESGDTASKVGRSSIPRIPKVNDSHRAKKYDKKLLSDNSLTLTETTRPNIIMGVDSQDGLRGRRINRVKKQKSDSSLDSVFSSKIALKIHTEKPRISAGRSGSGTTSKSESVGSVKAQPSKCQKPVSAVLPSRTGSKIPTMASRLPVSSRGTPRGRDATNRTAPQGRPASSSADGTPVGGCGATGEGAQLSGNNTASGVRVESADSSPRLSWQSEDHVEQEDDERYVSYLVTTPDSEIPVPVYTVDSATCSFVSEDGSDCVGGIVEVEYNCTSVPVVVECELKHDCQFEYPNTEDIQDSEQCVSGTGVARGSIDADQHPVGNKQAKASRLETLFRGRGGGYSNRSSSKSSSTTSTGSQSTVKNSGKRGDGTDSKSESSEVTKRPTGIPRICVSRTESSDNSEKSNLSESKSSELRSFLLKYRPSVGESVDPEVMAAVVSGHARADSGVYSMAGSQRARKNRRQLRRIPKGCGGSDVEPAVPMGSSASRQPGGGGGGGLAGRRAHSSGSLPRVAASSTSRPRASKLCKERAALCGSLPNHLDCNDGSNGLDQGYGSERSPDDEEEEEDDEEPCHCARYPFLNTASAFEVHLVKGSRGLGLSVCGGADSSERWPGLVRVKRLFPQQPAWLSGRLQPGDVLLAANGVSLVGLTDYQALEVLRRTPPHVVLRAVRPPASLLPAPPPAPGQPPPPPRREPAQYHHLQPPPVHTGNHDDVTGEFDIVLTKVNRSLGFTLRKEDESVLGHYVRALVREPALSDGRIRPGDKIVAVNDVDISPMSHEEAVMFLRQCGDVVKLRLYRDESQTPVSALSPTEEEKLFKPKPLLRKEARDMLTDLAVRKLSPGEPSYSGSKLRRVSADSSPCSSPRRRNLMRASPSDNKAATLERMPAGRKYMVSSQSQTSTSDSSEEQSQNNSNTLTCSSSAEADGDSMRAHGHASSFSSTAGSVGEPVKPPRPNFLDLCGAVSGTTPLARKPRLIFDSSGEAEWEEDDREPPPEPAPGSPCHRYSSCCSSNDMDILPSTPLSAAECTEPVSMPPLSSTSSTSTAFSYRNPAYQSAVDSSSHRAQADRGASSGSGAGAGGLLKWKGVVFTPEDGNIPPGMSLEQTPPEPQPESDAPADYQPGDQIFMVELTRGWNSRLGFSLQGDGEHTFISAIYADSVAAKDGRLKTGDRVLMVNDENVDKMSTADVIDLLRKIRGTIGITVLRKCGPKSEATPT